MVFCRSSRFNTAVNPNHPVLLPASPGEDRLVRGIAFLNACDDIKRGIVLNTLQMCCILSLRYYSWQEERKPFRAYNEAAYDEFDCNLYINLHTDDRLLFLLRAQRVKSKYFAINGCSI